MDDIVEAVGDWWAQAVGWENEGEGVVEVEEGVGQLSMRKLVQRQRDG